MKNTVAVLGAGSWGTTIAALTSKNTKTRLWARNSALAEEINCKHTNTRYLPDAVLPEKLVAFNSIETAIQDVSAVLVAVPSHGFRSLLTKLRKHIDAKVPIISLAKGLEQHTHFRMTEIIAELLPDHPVGVLTGPNLAGEIISGMTAAAVLAMADDAASVRLAKTLGSSRFRIYTNTDVLGCEISGALKNVIAIACGMADGAGAGDNIRSAFITRGLAEITRLGVAMGGKPESFAGLAGMGDLIATCTSTKSRNHHVGEQLGKGRALADITQTMYMVAEGLNTTKIMLSLGQRYQVDLPIAAQVHSVISGTATVQQALMGYLRRQPPGNETGPG